MPYDRGEPRELRFAPCERGFTLSTYNIGTDRTVVWAFEKIEDVADWLEIHYRNVEEQEEEISHGNS